MKRYWEIVADNLKKAGWSWGCVAAVDSEGRTIWIANPHRGDGKRFVVRADEKLSAFVELDAAIRNGAKLSCKPIWFLNGQSHSTQLFENRGVRCVQLRWPA